jgi:hypothetical protein
VPVPGLANDERVGIRRGKLTINKNDMHDIFEPIIYKIIRFVQEQIRLSGGKAKSVLLVGGFGQNTYLKERLREALPNIEVLQPPNAWTAIVRGAVMMGLSNANTLLSTVQIVSRRARKHYGIKLNSDYDKDKHDKNERQDILSKSEIENLLIMNIRYWCPYHGCYRVAAMEWFIRKGDVVEENKPKKIKFHKRFPVSEGRRDSYNITVFADSESSVAPVHHSNNVKTLMTLKINLSSISKSQWKKLVRNGDDGKKYYIVDGNIECTFLSASTTYKLFCEWGLSATVTAEYA